MTFERSRFGQKNRALFYDVEAIVYVEGGLQTGGPEEAFDIAFWHVFFAEFFPGESFRLIAKGSKSNIEKLLENQNSEVIENIFFVMDRDYDEILGRLKSRKDIIYTHGYSFENDIFTREAIAEIFYYFCPVSRADVNIAPQVNSWYDNFTARLRWPHFTDLFARIREVAGLDRTACRKYFVSNAYSAEPEICKYRIAAEVERINGTIQDRTFNLIFTHRFDPKNIVGHILTVFALRCLTCLHSRHSRLSKLTEDGVFASAIQQFAFRLRSNNPDQVVQYYKDQAVRVFS